MSNLFHRGGDVAIGFRAVCCSVVCLFALALLSACSNLPFMDSSSAPGDFPKRIYVAGGAGISRLTPEVDAPDSDYALKKSRSSAYWGSLGMDISERLALEAHFSDLGSASVQPKPDQQATLGSDEKEITYRAVGVSGLVYGLANYSDLAEREGLAAYLRLGVTKMDNQANLNLDAQDNLQIWFGVGGEYMFKGGLAARAELSSYDGDAQAVQVGLLYRFGDSRSEAAARRASADSPEVVTPPVMAEPLPEPEESVTPMADVTPEPTVELESETETEPEAQPDTEPEPQEPPADIEPSTPDLTTEPETVVAETGLRGVLGGVEFVAQSDQLTESGQLALGRVADALLLKPDTRIEIQTHTDNSIPADVAMRLTRTRAVAVARFLVSQGVSKSRLAARAFGANRARADNDTEEGRLLNNRVELKLLP